MNQTEPSSRWVREARAAQAAPAERAVLEEVLASLRRITHGTVEITVQDGRVVQINTTEKKRL